MIFQVMDSEEEIPKGELVSCSLSSMLDKEDCVNLTYNNRPVSVFKFALAAKEAESTEESDFILSLYKKLCRKKVVILNIDPSVRGFETSGYQRCYYGGYLTKGESFNGEDIDITRVNFYTLIMDMLLESGKEFVEIRLNKNRSRLLYVAYLHRKGESSLINSFYPSNNPAELAKFVNSISM